MMAKRRKHLNFEQNLRNWFKGITNDKIKFINSQEDRIPLFVYKPIEGQQQGVIKPRPVKKNRQ